MHSFTEAVILEAKFYDNKQEVGKLKIFVTRMFQFYQHLMPDMSEKMLIENIIWHVKPEAREYIASFRFYTEGYMTH